MKVDQRAGMKYAATLESGGLRIGVCWLIESLSCLGGFTEVTFPMKIANDGKTPATHLYVDT
jgi:hypothetical protein